MITASTFLNKVFDTNSIPDDEVVCVACKKARGFSNQPLSIDLDDNATSSNDPFYFCVSTVQKQSKLKRSRKDTRCAYLIGLDDIGTKAIAPGLEPSYKIETSPGNFQWGYCIEPYELDGPGGPKTEYYEACVQGLIAARMSDPGAVGCYRLLRIPGSINLKPESSGFRARVTQWEPDRIWELSALMTELGVKPVYRTKSKLAASVNTDTLKTDDVLLAWMQENDLIVESGEDFHKVICPWAHEHTDGEEHASYSPKGFGTNEFSNARQFNCFHAHCTYRNIQDYLEHTSSQGAPAVGDRFDITLETAKNRIEQLVARNDNGAWFEEDSMEALVVLQASNTPEYQRTKSKIREIKGLSITDLEKEMRRNSFEELRRSELTHNVISKSLLADMTSEDTTSPISCYGEIYRYRDGVWISFSDNKVASFVADSRYDGQKICRLGPHYQAISKIMYIQKIDEDFFHAAPMGVATERNFYRITKQGGVVKSLLDSSHRCRFKLPFEPNNKPTPLFDKFLDETFASTNSLETQQQKLVLQEVVGGALIGALAQFHKAIILYGATRAGKGVLVKIIQAMLPKEVISAISPFKWGHEYHVAAMAGKRLNLCGEFPEDNQIPAAAFKQIVGGDPISGRNPAGRVFTFVADASQIFSCNYLPYCREQSESFYNRWQVIHFPMSVPANKRDPQLADKIIEQELAGILSWALEGASRLIKQQRFSDSIVHDQIMPEWRTRSDSVAAFCSVQGRNLIIAHEKRTKDKMPTKDFYSAYEVFCDEERTKSAGKKTFFARLESINGFSIKHTNSGDKVLID